MNEIFTLAHLSDFHLFSLKGARVRDLLNKRIYAYLRWRIHRFTEHRADILKALASDLKKMAPDYIVITGDLTHSGLAGECVEAEKALRGLGAPEDVTVIPGNHDAYVSAGGLSPLSSLSPYMASDPPRRIECLSTDLSCPFPTLRIRRHVALIGLSTARPCLPFLAVGRLGINQLARLDALLEETGRRGLFRVVLIHHPPCEGMMSWRKRLMDLDSFGRVLTGRGAELVLHGHTHRSAYRWLGQSTRAIPVIGVPSSTALGRTREKLARYHVYSIPERPAATPFSVRVRVYSPISGGSFIEEPFSSSGQRVIGRS
jgi:3',5'-cyclic AMP phosphodiesterase CpdA